MLSNLEELGVLIFDAFSFSGRTKYTIIIQWSDEDNCYIVSLPEWGEFCHTHGDTYEEAIKNAQEVLEMLIESALENGESLPEPKT